MSIENTEIVTLDLRNMPAPQRHPLIFSTFESLPVGHILKLVNDHDPKPLYYQFLYERKDTFEWNYQQEGPVDWEVDIKKVK